MFIDSSFDVYFSVFWSKNTISPTFLALLYQLPTIFQNSFAGTFGSKSTIKWWFKITPTSDAMQRCLVKLHYCQCWDTFWINLWCVCTCVHIVFVVARVYSMFKKILMLIYVTTVAV